MKKIIAMLLVLVMSVTGLVGCGSSNKSGSEAGSTSTSSDSDWAYIQGNQLGQICQTQLVLHYLHR